MKYLPTLLFIITEASMLAIVIIIFSSDKYEFLEKIALSVLSIVCFNFILLLTYLFISYVGETKIKKRANKIKQS